MAFAAAALLPAGPLAAQAEDPDDGADEGARRISPGSKDEGDGNGRRERRRRVKDRDEPRDEDDSKDRESRKKSSRGDDDDEGGGDDDRPADAKVPGWARGKGYRLRIGSEESKTLSGDTVRVPRSDRRQRVELVDAQGRLLSDDRVYIDEHVFDHLSERSWRVGLYFGSAHAAGQRLRGVLQDGSFSESSFDVVYQPGPIGAAFSYASHSSDDGHERGVDSNYEADYWRFAATYELVPAQHSSGSMRRVHLVVFAGAQSALHRVTITDGVVELKDESRGYGPHAGLEVLYPFGSFWLAGKGYVSQQTIKFDKLGYAEPSVQQGYLLGGFYAF